jgi:hypothetical protein
MIAFRRRLVMLKDSMRESTEKTATAHRLAKLSDATTMRMIITTHEVRRVEML